MRRKLLAANWKMHTTLPAGLELAQSLSDIIQPADEVEVVLCAPFTHLAILNEETEFSLGAQNCHWEDHGAYTGEVSAAMLASIGVEYVIIGHSERRQIFDETHEQLRGKVDTAVRHRLKPIFCCGETLEERSLSKQQQVVTQQIEESLFHLESAAIGQVVIAYEPVWAIGTGEVASPEQAQEMHAFIRALIAGKFGRGVADSLRILYGGSVKPSNSAGLFDQADIDGALVGGASLDAEEFRVIHDHLLNAARVSSSMS
jgi:triosephosphate isomerase